MNVEQEKRLAAEAAAELVEDGMIVGLGTGSTVGFLLPALARRRLSISCVATSPRTMRAASGLGLDVRPFDIVDHLDMAIDGADQIAPDGWLVKGGGGAHTREKIVAAAASRFVMIGDSRKPVEVIRAPTPLELLEFGLSATLRRLVPALVRAAPKSTDGGILADFHGDVGEPARLSEWLSATPGVVGHGLFPSELVTEVLIGCGDSIERRTVRP
ncbi:ribose 5-phosphate isomerase A [Actinomadura scrupuli]|uniref:ribose 5-phosphate isomerase A n=1 Tax=Actinomadura scrupuli TaxID=559629 RepID=UPI003D980FAD